MPIRSVVAAGSSTDLAPSIVEGSNADDGVRERSQQTMASEEYEHITAALSSAETNDIDDSRLVAPLSQFQLPCDHWLA